jgi:hypothetical protein
MAAPEAAFKDVPEIFEVCFLRYHICFFEHRTGRIGRSTHRANRSSWSVSMNLWRASHSPTSLRSHFPRTRSTGSLSCRQKYWTHRTARCKRHRSYYHSCISNREQLGSYHYVSGIDTSSSASLAAYINSLTYSIEEPQAWFTKGPTWKVKNGCFWCVRHVPVSMFSSPLPCARSLHSPSNSTHHPLPAVVSTRFRASTCV